MNPSDSSTIPQEFTGPQLATMRQLTDADKLRKVICELLETERTYVKVSCLHLSFPLQSCISLFVHFNLNSMQWFIFWLVEVFWRVQVTFTVTTLYTRGKFFHHWVYKLIFKKTPEKPQIF